MENNIVEHYDKTRFKLIKWFTIGWGIWFGNYIFKEFIDNEISEMVLTLVGLCGWLIFIWTLIRLIKIGSFINKDTKLKNALNDELHKFNIYKSVFISYWILLSLIGVSLLVSVLFNISAFIICEILLYIAIMSLLISSLIINRD